MIDSDVVVMGGGIAGLVTAYKLSQRGVQVRLLEQSTRVGGSICTIRDDAYIFERGPNTIQKSSSELEDLISELGLQDQIVLADSRAAKRYIVRNGRPVRVPGGPIDLLTTKLFSWPARLSILSEPLRKRGTNDSETVAGFVRRRLHPELLTYAIDPMVGGIHAGDPEALSMRLAFPRMHTLESQYGSLIRGALSRSRRRNAHRPAWKMFSFKRGLAALPESIVESGRFPIQTGASVREADFQGDRWVVKTSEGESFGARAIVWALPLTEDGPALVYRGMNLPTPVAEYAAVAVVSAAYTSRTILHPLDGFGMLVPSVETSTRILGTLFTSSIFPACTPDDAVMLTSFVGGTRHPHHLDLSDRDVVELVHSDNTRLLGITSSPRRTEVTRWQHAIPQYTVGHEAVVSRLRTLQQDLPRLAFAGNFLRGVSVPDTIASAYDAAARIADQLRSG